MKSLIATASAFVVFLASSAFAGIGLVGKDPGKVHYFMKNGTQCAIFVNHRQQKMVCILDDNLRIDNEESMTSVKEQLERGFWAVFHEAPEKSWFEMRLTLPQTIRVYFSSDPNGNRHYAQGEGSSIEDAISALIKNSLKKSERKV